MTIDNREFSKMWNRLCLRFNRPMRQDEAAAYKTYLEGQGMDTDAFVAAAGSVWATREWFPRPADFLLVEIGWEWNAVVAALDSHQPPHKSGWELLTPGSRAQRAVSSLGGLHGLKDLYQRDPIRARREFLQAYELEIAEESQAFYLQAPEKHAKVLPIGQEERRLMP